MKQIRIFLSAQSRSTTERLLTIHHQRLLLDPMKNASQIGQLIMAKNHSTKLMLPKDGFLFFLRFSYLYLPSDGLVSLAEVFFAGQLDNDASVLTALNNTKTHLSKHGPCFALTVFAAPLQFWCFSCLSQRGGLHFKERQSCNFVSTNLQFSPFCQQLSSRSIQSPISATRIFSVLPPSQPNSIAAHSRHANLVL